MSNIKTVNDILEKGKENCCGCYSCFNICPVNAIKMLSDDKGFSYPVIDKEKCINCGLCFKVCPVENVDKEKKKELIAYAMYNKDDNIRLNSSSGGIFSLLAKYILDNNGIVYGAAFNEVFNVEHIRIDNINDLKYLRTSKYVQSEIGDSYKKAKEDLENKKLVLFTGTPCQIEGLKKYLQKEYINLYTQDIVCFGVPSKLVWQKYLTNIKKDENINSLEKEKIIIEDINFRNKDNGWKGYTFKIRTNKNIIQESRKQNPYMQLFLNGLIVRDSCFNCKFKKKYRESDITLGDLWGSQELEKEIDDDKGLSLVVVNSDRGKELIEKIKEYTIFKETDLDLAILKNMRYIESVPYNKNREKVFKNLDNLTLDKIVNKYKRKPKLLKRLKSKYKK